MSEKNDGYKVTRRESDGTPVILLRRYNVVIAEFSKGCAIDAEIIGKILDEHAEREANKPTIKT